jgi:biotin carboxyl carrier protein
MAVNAAFLKHPVAQRLPKTEQEWLDFVRVLTSFTTTSEMVTVEIDTEVAAVQADADAAQAAADAAQSTANAAALAASDAQVTADAAVAAAAAAQADANDVWITAFIEDIDADGSSSADGRMNIVSPVAGTVTLIYTVINSAVPNATVITPSIDGTPITGGAVTIGALSVQGDVDSATPSAANTVAVGDTVKVSSDGAAGLPCKAQVLMKVTRS